MASSLQGAVVSQVCCPFLGSQASLPLRLLQPLRAFTIPACSLLSCRLILHLHWTIFLLSPTVSPTTLLAQEPPFPYNQDCTPSWAGNKTLLQQFTWTVREPGKDFYCIVSYCHNNYDVHYVWMNITVVYGKTRRLSESSELACYMN